MHEYAGGQWFFEGNRLVSRQPGEMPRAVRENAGEAWKGEVVSVGLSWVCWELARKSGIYRDLQEVFGKEKTRKLLTIASYMLYTGKSVVRDVDEWQRDVWLPKDEKLSPEVVSDLLAGISRQDFDAYFRLRYDAVSSRYRQRCEDVGVGDAPMAIAFDSTSISTDLSKVSNANYRGAKSNPLLMQVNLILCVDCDTGDVCYACENEGSVNGEGAFSAALRQMLDSGFDPGTTVVVTDREVASLFNSQGLVNPGTGFVQRVSLYDESLGKDLLKYREGLRNLAPVDSEIGIGVKAIEEGPHQNADFGSAGARTYLHFYKDFTLEHDQKMNLMSSVRKIVDAMNQKEQVDSNEYDRYARFITRNKNTGRFDENLELLAKESELFGAFVLRSNVISDPLVALKFYRMRNSAEASFRQFKSCAGKGRLHPVEKICTGQLFTFVLAESLRMMLLMASKNTETGKKLPKDSLNAAFIQLKRLKAEKPRGRNTWIVKEIPKKTRDLFELFDLIPPPRILRD